VLAVCGFSGSGKTTLLEATIPRLVERGLALAVVKHDAHGFQVDREGKDSDRLFRAGATVALRGPQEQFQRRAGWAALSLEATLAELSRDHDLVLVEGNKETPLPKLWMGDQEGASPPVSVVGLQAILPWDSDRVGEFLSFLDGWLPRAWRERPIYLGLRLGAAHGDTKRNAQGAADPAVGLAEILGSGYAGSGYERLVALGGNAQQAPARATWLAPPPDFRPLPEDDDPAALGVHLIAAHRWAPPAAWIVVEEHLCAVARAAWEWLSSFRRPGTWAVLPRKSDGGACLALSLYEPQALTWLERRALAGETPGAAIAALVGNPRTVSPELPPELRS
jgi:molybdopterin-guanine dinucleotide biosynthesis protein MobB